MLSVYRLTDCKDKNGNTPLDFLSANTPLSAVSVLGDSMTVRKSVS